ncbi:aminopeptidase N-like isoform X2 [Linepithema humile]
MTYIHIMFDSKNFDKYHVGANGDQVVAATGIKIMRFRQLLPWPTTISSKLEKQGFKASFNISIKHEQNYTVLSNMPVLTKYKDKNYMWTCFKQSPYMFAKHLTIVITTFSNIALSSNIKFWCRKNMTKLVQIAKTNVKRIARYLIKRNVMKVPKMDYVVIKDFNHNVPTSDNQTWGLILQRDTSIIYNKKLDSAMRKIQIAHLIAHQMASLCYIDAILWSKNSFTMFLGTFILDKIRRNGHMMDLIVVQMQEFFRFVIPSYVNPLLSINTNITKNKLLLSSLHNMKSFAMWRLLHFISNGIFWTGIRKYIHTYNSGTTNDYNNLWSVMQRTINSRNSKYKLNIKNLIDIWTTKTYYPVLNVTRDYRNNAVEIVFVKSIDIIDKDTENWIPVTYTTNSSLHFTKANNLFWLNSYNQSYRIEGINRDDWIIVNIQQIGYYRVIYDLENWKKLAHYLNYENTEIHVLNRAQIIDDAYHFLLQKQISYKMFWNITSFLTQDTDYVAWYPMIKAFEHIMCIFPIEHSKDVTRNMIRMLEALVINIGYYKRSGDNDLTKCLREEMIKWTCIFDISDCRKIATTKLQKMLNLGQKIDLSPKEWIYCKGSMVTNVETLHSLWLLWQETLDTRILEFMACSENSIVIHNYLKDVKLEKYKTEFKANEQAYIFLFTVAKHANKDTVFTMILHNFDNLKPKQVNTIATLIVIITHIQSVHNLKMVETFAKDHYSQQIPIQAVRRKIKKRKQEYSRLIENYMLLI